MSFTSSMYFLISIDVLKQMSRHLLIIMHSLAQQSGVEVNLGN